MAEPFAGFELPYYTQIPDQLFDALLPDLSGAELKVLLYIMRRTFGFKRDADDISVTQICHGITTRDGRQLDRGTGLSRSTAHVAIRALIDGGYVVALHHRDRERGDQSTTYAPRMRQGVRFPDRGESDSRTGGSPTIGQGGVRQSDPQETALRETVRETGVTPPSDPHALFRALTGGDRPPERRRRR